LQNFKANLIAAYFVYDVTTKSVLSAC